MINSLAIQNSVYNVESQKEIKIDELVLLVRVDTDCIEVVEENIIVKNIISHIEGIINNAPVDNSPVGDYNLIPQKNIKIYENIITQEVFMQNRYSYVILNER